MRALLFRSLVLDFHCSLESPGESFKIQPAVSSVPRLPKSVGDEAWTRMLFSSPRSLTAAPVRPRFVRGRLGALSPLGGTVAPCVLMSLFFQIPEKCAFFSSLFFFPPCVFVFGLVFVAVCIFLAHLQLIWMENYLLKWVFLDVFLSLSTVF